MQIRPNTKPSLKSNSNQDNQNNYCPKRNRPCCNKTKQSLKQTRLWTNKNNHSIIRNKLWRVQNKLWHKQKRTWHNQKSTWRNLNKHPLCCRQKDSNQFTASQDIYFIKKTEFRFFDKAIGTMQNFD